VTAPAIRRLTQLFESGRLLAPDSGGPSTVHLARALAAVAGTRDFEGESGEIAGVLGQPEHMVLVLADGLGMHLIENLPEDSFLRRHLALELRAVFPSSTAPALTSLATGLWPSAHALPTWFTYLPHAGLTAIVLPFKDRASDQDLLAAGVKSEITFPAPAAARFYRRDFAAYQPNHIAKTTYTRFLCGGADARPYRRLSDAFAAVAERVRAATAPTYTYVYWPEVDVREHEHGALSREAQREAFSLDRELKRLREELPASATVAVSADHGLVTVAESLKVVLADGDELQQLLRVWPPAGEPRVLSFHLKPGCKAAFREVFERRFGEEFILLSTDEAEELRLFGPAILSPETRGRVGDFIAIPAGLQVMGYGGEKSVLRMKGFHGGLAPEEMRVPLVIA
jgi:hypothetical protein